MIFGSYWDYPKIENFLKAPIDNGSMVFLTPAWTSSCAGSCADCGGGCAGGDGDGEA